MNIAKMAIEQKYKDRYGFICDELALAIQKHLDQSSMFGFHIDLDDSIRNIDYIFVCEWDCCVDDWYYDIIGNKWDSRFMDLARFYSSWSKDPSTKVGAVIVDGRRRTIGHGYNGFPRGVDDSPERYIDRSQKYPRVVHAEMNAILNTGVPMALEGATLYATLPPCEECAKAIIQTGIKRVVTPRITDPDQKKRWEDSMGIAESMFAEAGVTLSRIFDPQPKTKTK